MADGLIAVTGATGEVGGRVAERLAEAGHDQRLVVRDASRAPDLEGAEVRVASDYGDHDEMQAALEGVDTLLLIPAAEHPDRIQQHLTAVAAAVAAGVRRIVYLSFVGAAADSTFTLGRHHWATEQAIRESGVKFTFPRMNLYMDFIPSMVGPTGVIAGPAGDGRLAAILRDDVAAVLESVLTGDGHDGATYDLTGPAAFSLGEAAEVMGELTSKSIRFQNETPEEAYASRAQYGAPDWEVEGWVTSYQTIADGSLEHVSSHVLALTGEAPTSLRDWLTRDTSRLDHVTT
jgi:NAD(P)H dehydrogenase (quinone)